MIAALATSLSLLGVAIVIIVAQALTLHAVREQVRHMQRFTQAIDEQQRAGALERARRN